MMFYFFYFSKDKAIEFSKKVLEWASYNITEISEDEEDFYDILVSKNENKYAVIVKDKITTNQLNKIEEIRKNLDKDYKILIFVLTEVNLETKQKLKNKYNIEILDISNIIFLISKNEELMNELKDLIDYSISNIEKVKPNVYFEIKEEKINQIIDYENELNLINPGLEQWGDYQRFCVKLLKDMFRDDLDSWSSQNATEEKSNIFDLIARIKYRKKEEYNDFFYMVENSLNSKYVLFEFKNYTNPIGKNEILTTENYLYGTALRKIAIILTRNGAGEDAKKQIRKAIREQGKVIIVLDDKDVKNMIKLWRENKDSSPSIIFQEKLNQLFMNLEQ